MFYIGKICNSSNTWKLERAKVSGAGFTSLFYTTLLPFFVYGVAKIIVKKGH